MVNPPSPAVSPHCSCGADSLQSARYGHPHLAWCALFQQSVVSTLLEDERWCNCADPENCREVPPGYVCQRIHGKLPAVSDPAQEPWQNIQQWLDFFAERLGETGLTIRMHSLACFVEQARAADQAIFTRLQKQAQDISICLTEAGIGPCSIPEGVKQLLQRAEQAEATCTALRAELDNVGEALDGEYPGTTPSPARAVQQQREALDKAKAEVTRLTQARDEVLALIPKWRQRARLNALDPYVKVAIAQTQCANELELASSVPSTT